MKHLYILCLMTILFSCQSSPEAKRQKASKIFYEALDRAISTNQISDDKIISSYFERKLKTENPDSLLSFAEGFASSIK